MAATDELGIAAEVCPDQQVLLYLDDAAWTEFLAILDRPVTHRPRLARLMSEDSIFTES